MHRCFGLVLLLLLTACSSSTGTDDSGITPDHPRPNEAGKPPGCGNGKLDPDESCDGAELDDQTCEALGYLRGTLACHENCHFDESGCSRCGDGKLQGDEVCDGAELGGATCVSLGFTGGTVGCKPSCVHDTSQCTGSRPGEATLVYGTPKEIVARTMDTANSTWGGKVTLTQVIGTRWVVSRASPVNPGRAVVVAQTQNIGAVELLSFHQDSPNWNKDASIKTNVVDGVLRVFDVVYQDKSGVPLLVYSNNTNNPMYRTFNGNTWSSEQTVFTTPPGNDPVRWVVLASRPGSNEVALVYSDLKKRLYAVIWDGNSFRESDTEATLSSESMGHSGQSFDAAYEDQSGDLLIVSSDNCCMCFGYYWRKPSLWTTLGKPPFVSEGGGPCGRWGFQKLAAQRGSDAIALTGDEATAVIWGGAAFYGAVHLWPGPHNHMGTIWADVAWVGRQPTAVLVHRGWTLTEMPEGLGHLHWLRSQPGGAWVNGKPYLVKGLGELTQMQLESYPAEDRVLAVFSDDAHKLFAATYDVAHGWQVTNKGPLALDLNPATSTRPFSVHIAQK